MSCKKEGGLYNTPSPTLIFIFRHNKIPGILIFKTGFMANNTVYFNQFNQLVFAHVQFPYQKIDPETAFTMRIDPRNYFPPLGEQLACYKHNQAALNHWTFYAKQMLDSQGGYFKATHNAEMCRTTQIGIGHCNLACRNVHHYPVYLALGGAPFHKPKPKAAEPVPEMPGLTAIAAARSKSEEKHSQERHIHFGLPPLKIDEYVEQPIQKLNEETDREERERQIGQGEL